MNISIPKISIDSNDEQDSTDIISSQQGIDGLLNCSSAKGSATSLYSSDMLAPIENDVALLPRSPIMRRGRMSSEKEIEDVANPKQQKISKIELMKKLFSFEPKAKKTDDSIGLSPDDSDSRNASKTSLNGSRRNSQTSLLASKNNASGSRSNTSLFRNMAKRLSFVNVNDPVNKLEKIDGYIMKLRECTQSHGFPLSCDEVKELCRDVKELVSSQPILLELSPPINICGDIHGQYKDLLEIFNICGEPGISNYLFLGDYVDRGQMSLETITLMMCYKLKYPDTFFMLRGNHECSNINRVYGFFDECKRKLNTKIWKCFTEFFEYLPLAAVIGHRVFCVHGGISPFLQSLDDIKKIERPLYIERTGLQADLLWSDPSDTTEFWQENEDRGVSYVFGAPQVNNFLKKFDFDLIVRAHMVVEDGYQFFNDKSLVTIFSAPNYCGNFDNLGGILCIDQKLTVTFKFITAKTYEIMD